MAKKSRKQKGSTRPAELAAETSPKDDAPSPRTRRPPLLKAAPAPGVGAPEITNPHLASVKSNPTQGWVGAKTGVQLGPQRPVRVRIIR